MPEVETSMDAENKPSYDFLKYILQIQDERIRDMGNKANNSLILATIFIGIGFTIYSIDSNNGDLWNKLTMMSALLMLLLSIALSLCIMYMTALRPVPLVKSSKVYECIFDQERAEVCMIGSLTDLSNYNSKYFQLFQRLSFASYVLLLIGIFLEFRYATLIV